MKCDIYRPHPKDGRRYLFSVCLSVHISGGEGVPQSGLGGGTTSQVWAGGTPSQCWLGGYPIPGLGRGEGVPHPRSGQGGTRVLPQTWNGVPPWTWDWVPPRPGMGYSPNLGRGIPPPTWDIASTCYAAGGMPLAFTQEDFLVAYIFVWIYRRIRNCISNIQLIRKLKLQY